MHSIKDAVINQNYHNYAYTAGAMAPVRQCCITTELNHSHATKETEPIYGTNRFQHYFDIAHIISFRTMKAIIYYFCFISVCK